MKATRMLAAALLAGVLTVPAVAGDAVPQSTLKSLGLGQMQAMTDVDGLAVRGKSSLVIGTSSSAYSATLVDGNDQLQESSNSSILVIDANGGPGVTSTGGALTIVGGVGGLNGGSSSFGTIGGGAFIGGAGF